MRVGLAWLMRELIFSASLLQASTWKRERESQRVRRSSCVHGYFIIRREFNLPFQLVSRNKSQSLWVVCRDCGVHGRADLSWTLRAEQNVLWRKTKGSRFIPKRSRLSKSNGNSFSRATSVLSICGNFLQKVHHGKH